MQCSMRGLVDIKYWRVRVSMLLFEPLRRSNHAGASRQNRGREKAIAALLGLAVAGIASGCAGARYERGASAFDAAHAPVHMVAADAVGAGTVSVLITVRAGSAHDPTGYAGLAWTTAHAIGGRGEAALSDVDGRVAVRVGKELVSFQIDVPDSAEQALAAAVVEMFDLSAIDEADISDSKAEGVQWLTGGLATDAGRLADAAFERWVFEGHPYALPAEGRASGLASVDVAAVQRFQGARYGRPSISLEVRGAKQPHAVQDAFSSAPPQLYVDVTPRPVSPVKSHEVLVVQHDLVTTGLVLGHPLRVRPGHEDWLALTIGLSALSSDPSAAMTEFLSREDSAFRMQLASDQPQAGAGLFDAAMARASAFVGTGLSAEQLAETKSALTEGLAPATALGAASRARLMDRVGPAALVEAIRAVTLDQVNAALAEHVDPGALRVVLVGKADAFDGLTFETAHKVQGARLFE